MPNLRDELESALGDRYRLKGEIGLGGMGGMAWVFRATDLKHNREVALKVMRPELGAGFEAGTREVEMVARLRHPHIVPLFDSGKVGGGPGDPSPHSYYVMPFVEGESLRDRLQREEAIPLAQAIGIARDVAAALAYAHARGVIHRDLRPENILLTGGDALVADFGLAPPVQLDAAAQSPSTELALGTVAYLGPELAAGGTVDERANLYALGCMLYEMLTGELPHAGETAQELLTKRRTIPPPDVRASRPEVPASLALTLQRLLANKPEERYRTADQLLEALGAPPAGSPRGASSRRWLITVVLVLAILALGAFFIAQLRRR